MEYSGANSLFIRVLSAISARLSVFASLAYILNKPGLNYVGNDDFLNEVE